MAVPSGIVFLTKVTSYRPDHNIQPLTCLMNLFSSLKTDLQHLKSSNHLQSISPS